MSETLTKAIARPGVVPAFFAGLGVFALLLVIGFVQAIFSTLSLVTQTASQDFVGQLWLAQLVNSVSGPLPFAVGVFLCFWQIAPIAPMLRLAHVVTRSILAALLGAAAMFVVFLLSRVVVEISGAPFSFHASGVFGTLGLDALQALFSSLAMTTGYLPVVALAGILLWGWLQRHPLGRQVRGALDEV